jgi:hypothetical protein
MKNFAWIFCAFLISLNGFAQNSEGAERTVFQRIILDLGHSPYQVTLSDFGTVRSTNMAIGYEITRKVDLRLNVDLNTFYDLQTLGQGMENQYVNTTALSLGVNYNLMEGIFKGNTSLDVLGKVGIDIIESTMESLLFDVSARLKFYDMPYIGIGYRQHNIEVFGIYTPPESSPFNHNMAGIYVTFGVEF